MRSGLRRLFQALLVVAILGVGVFAVFPTRTYLAQQDATSKERERLKVLVEETEQLKARAAALDSDTEIERLAREDHGLVRPGEEAYRVLRPPLPPVDLPEMWLVGDPDGDPEVTSPVEVEAVPPEEPISG
ncbi:MAG TPA: septum formation initiator family protein [Acidimicrobiales bacterium]|nr:septum formation initiator family protein [Acidimicrobiales bacterium]